MSPKENTLESTIGKIKVETQKHKVSKEGGFIYLPTFVCVTHEIDIKFAVLLSTTITPLSTPSSTIIYSSNIGICLPCLNTYSLQVSSKRACTAAKAMLALMGVGENFNSKVIFIILWCQFQQV